MGSMIAIVLTCQTLQIFFAKVLSKRYTSPSSDIIEVLAGLDDVDYVFTDLVAALDGIIKDGRTSESLLHFYCMS